MCSSREMDTFTQSTTWHYFDVNKYIFLLLGAWPSQSSFRSLAIQIIFMTTFATGILTQIAKIITSRNDLTMVMNVIPCLTAVTAGSAKYCNYHYLNHDKMMDLIDLMKRDWQEQRSENEIKIMHNFGRLGRFYTICYAGCLSALCVFFSTMPAVPLILDVVAPRNESRQPLYIYPAEYFVDDEEYYCYITLHMCLVACVTVSTLVCMDSAFIVYIQHACGLYKIAGERIENALESDTVRELQGTCASISDAEYNRMLYGIKGHQTALQYAALIESAHTNTLLVVMGAVVVCLTTTLVQLNADMTAGRYTNILSYVILILGEMFHLFCLSYPGQDLYDHSATIFEKAYNASFYNVSVKTQRLVVLIMRRSLDPSVVTAGGFYLLLLTNFSSVLQTCVSYFTVLQSM